MIREQEKITKYNYKKPLRLVLIEYTKTIWVSLLIACVFTIALSIHARNELIKNLYISAEEQQAINKKLAEQFIQSHKDILSDIKGKKYIVCMHIGLLYETLEDYQKAQIAYESAVEKSEKNNYKAHYKLICTFLNQNEFDKATNLLIKISDRQNKNLIKFKTRAYLTIGDKYYSIGKFISAAKNYEKAAFYYNKFKKRDKVIEASIKNRIINAYIKAADEIVKMGYNSEAVRYLKKAKKYDPENLNIQYKIGIILSDSDPEKSLKYLNPLLKKIPQDIDYGVYCTALMKAANIADLEGRTTQSKYYRHRIHTIDLFIKRKVIYRNDIEILTKKFKIKKVLFTYPVKSEYHFINTSNFDINVLKADFVLCNSGQPKETITKTIVDENHILRIGETTAEPTVVNFKKSIFTKNELSNYSIKIYAYKDDEFKTLMKELTIFENR